MIERYIQVVCDNCNKVMKFYNFRILDVYSSIRSRSWAVSKDRQYTFCPDCKEKVSNVGRNGVNKLLPFSGLKEKRFARIREFERQEAEKQRLIYEEECLEFQRLNSD